MKVINSSIIRIAFSLIVAFAFLVIAQENSVKIGVAIPFTKEGSNVDAAKMRAAIMLKVEDINNNGGINGQPVQIVWGNDQCDAVEAGNVANAFISDEDVVAVIGHLCPEAASAAVSIYAREKLPCISPVLTSEIDGISGNGYLFEAGYDDGGSLALDHDLNVRFNRMTGEYFEAMSAAAYDCLGILAEVIARVGTDRNDIKVELTLFNNPKNVFVGITGVTYFDENLKRVKEK